jgi:hypothetical protein
VDKAVFLQGLARQYTKGMPDDALISKLDLDELTEGDIARASRLDGALKVHTVQWYPGHIAKAERQLKEQLKMVDVVLEVRDARIPLSTCHPQVPQWVGNKPRLVVFNREDMVSREDLAAWQQHLEATGQRVYWTNGKEGKGTHSLKRAVLKVGGVCGVCGLCYAHVCSCCWGTHDMSSSTTTTNWVRVQCQELGLGRYSCSA